MTSHRKEGRLAWLLTMRRLKSFKCFVVGAVFLNLLLFLSLAWKSMPRAPNVVGLPAGLIADSDFKDFVRVREHVVGVGVPLEAQANGVGDQRIVDNVTRSLTVLDKDGFQKTACSYRTAVYMDNIHIDLNQPPFVDYVKSMVCLDGGNIAAFSDKFVRFNNVIVDPSKITNERKGGEKMEDVWNQREDDEYFKLTSGFFKASCSLKPMFRFLNVDHLNEWARVLECYSSNKTDLTQFPVTRGTTLAIQRYEYVNLYHTMTDFYNAFVLMLIFGVTPSKLNILAVDAHPEGTFDGVWTTLFGKFIRAGRLERPTVFQNLVWGLLGYSSPLNEHDRPTVPYLEEFREFFLARHNVSTNHVIDCKKLNVLIIWRRDYVAHPRNPQGSVVRKFDNEDEIVQSVKETLGKASSVEGMQLDTLPMAVQLHAVAKADILVGMHGAGLSHILFLPPTSGVIEFKPEYSNPSLQHFKAMANWRNLPYTLWHNFDAQNEKPSYRTYIPRSAIEKTVIGIYKDICKKGV